MTSVPLGAAVGAGIGVALLLLASFVLAHRRPSLEQRVAPYLGEIGSSPTTSGGSAGRGAHGWRALVDLLAPSWRAAGRRLDGVLGGGASIRRRLGAAGEDLPLEQFRLEQLAWGATTFGGVTVALLVRLAAGTHVPLPAAVLLVAAAGVLGVLARDQALSRAVARRAARVSAELPTVADLLALAVAAGDGAAGALARVTRVCSGELAAELARVQADTRTGTGLTDALRAMADRLGVPMVSRFVDGIVIAVERGTPLADVLRAQATDAREQRRRELMDSAGRREIAMLVPVVFLILPVTVLFALFPGFYGLSLSVS